VLLQKTSRKEQGNGHRWYQLNQTKGLEPVEGENDYKAHFLIKSRTLNTVQIIPILSVSGERILHNSQVSDFEYYFEFWLLISYIAGILHVQ